MDEVKERKTEKIEDPDELTFKTVIKWSGTYKKLELLEEKGIITSAIRSEALKFLENDCIEYNKEKKCYLCNPIAGYNFTIYELKPKGGDFECSCDFTKRVEQIPGLVCPHILALKLMLKMWNYNRRKYKEQWG